MMHIITAAAEASSSGLSLTEIIAFAIGLLGLGGSISAFFLLPHQRTKIDAETRNLDINSIQKYAETVRTSSETMNAIIASLSVERTERKARIEELEAELAAYRRRHGPLEGTGGS